jgi:hypothetical protein
MDTPTGIMLDELRMAMSSRSSVSWHPMIVFCCFWPGCTQPCLQAEWSSSRSIAACYLMEAECVSNIITSSWTLRNGCVACATDTATKRTKKAGHSTRPRGASFQSESSIFISILNAVHTTHKRSKCFSLIEKSQSNKNPTLLSKKCSSIASGQVFMAEYQQKSQPIAVGGCFHNSGGRLYGEWIY